MAKVEFTYFGIQAEMGFTKHGGSLASTDELARLCRINKDSKVLDVGCGVGMTPIYLAKKFGCQVVGVDISPKMIEQSKKKAVDAGVDDKVSFRVANAEKLPFKNGEFDVVICESVLIFVKNRKKAIKEFLRVTKKGGYIGCNEETLLKPAPKNVVESFTVSLGISDLPSKDEWTKLFKSSGVKDLVVKVYKPNALREGFRELKRIGFLNVIVGIPRMIWLTITHFKEMLGYMKSVKKPPLNVFKYVRYGLYVGKK